MGIRLVPDQDHSQIEKVAHKEIIAGLKQHRLDLILLLSANGLNAEQIAHEIRRDIQRLRGIYSYSIYPALEAMNQRHAVLRAVELGWFSLSQAQKNYTWEDREPLTYAEMITLFCLLRDSALPDREVARRVPQSYSQFRDNVTGVKVKLHVGSDAQLLVITLASLATVINFEVPPLPGELYAVHRNLAFYEGAPYPYPREWDRFLASASTQFPPTLKKYRDVYIPR